MNADKEATMSPSNDLVARLRPLQTRLSVWPAAELEEVEYHEAVSFMRYAGDSVKEAADALERQQRELEAMGAERDALMKTLGNIKLDSASLDVERLNYIERNFHCLTFSCDCDGWFRYLPGHQRERVASMCDAIDAALAEHNPLFAERDALKANNLSLHEQVAALQSREVCTQPHDNVETCGYCQRDALKKDAGRYRWLRVKMDWLDDYVTDAVSNELQYTREVLDAAIDAAIEKEIKI